MSNIVFDRNNVIITSPVDEHFYVSDVLSIINNSLNDEVDWSQAPDNAVVYAEDANGDGAWYNTIDIGANTRFGDWQHSQTHEVHSVYIGVAPKFGTTKHAYTDSIRFREIDSKFKIKIIIEEI